MGQHTITIITLFLAFILNLGLGLLVYSKDSPHRRVSISFSLLTWALAAWAFSILMIFMFKEPRSRLFWVKMSYVTASYIPSTFLYFSRIFPKEKSNLSLLKISLIFLFSSIFAALSFSQWMVRSADWQTLTISYGVAHRCFSIFLILFVFAGIFSIAKSLFGSVGLERLQIKYCLFGMLVSAIIAVSLNVVLPSLGTSRLSSWGPPSTLIMVCFITYSILKHHLLDINIVLKKGTTYFLLGLLLLIPSAVLISLSQHFLFQKISYVLLAIVLSIIVLASVLFNYPRPQTEKAVEHLLFKHRYDYRETLGNFSKAMVTILDLQSLSKRIIEVITQTMGVEKASLFLLNEEKGGYYLFDSKDITISSSLPVLGRQDPLPYYLQKIGEIVVREELVKGAGISELKNVTDKMSLLEAEVSIPLMLKGKLLGMMNLSHKFNKDVYSHEDIELLSTLANQAAIAVENARLYEDLKKSKSYIQRADRLASLGTLTAGLAHEIRNPLVAIKTFTQLLPERLDDDEFRNEFLAIASGEVDRISMLINELLDFARPSDPRLEPEDINSILDGMILLVSTESKKKHVQVQKNYTPDLPLVSVDREQIKQVFLNILLNAVDATPENGEIVVKTRSFVKPGGDPYIQVEFTDTGCGIPSVNLEDIFNPFFTTKNKGSGLGLSISNQIVQDHKGYIHVESEINKGSSFFINLPLNPQPSPSTQELGNREDIFSFAER